jgi:hypothetical protein
MTGHTIHVPVWFDAWKYENQANMIFPLLHAFRQSQEGVLAISSEPGFGETLRQATMASALAVLDVGLRVSTRVAFGEAIKLKDLTDDLTLAGC